MKAKSRRRLLLSSVAMLLVAMLALGTATFAWFTTSSSAQANNINVKTIKASELKLQSMETDWTDTLDYGFTSQVLKPASSGNGVNWYKAEAAAKTGFAANTDTIGSAGSYDKASKGINGYVFMDQLNIANFGGADVNNVKIQFSLSETPATSGSAAKYVRLAIVEASASGYGTTSLPALSGTFGATGTVYAAGADTADAFIPGTGDAVTTTAIAAASAASTVTVNVGNLAGKTGSATMGGAKYYNIYVWFEGQDEDCKDANAGAELPNFTFSVTGDTVEG